MTDSNCRRWMMLGDREATGEPLSLLDREWCTEHAAHCPECAGESRLWAALGEVMARPELLDSTLSGASPGSVPDPRVRDRSRLRKSGAWLLAAAAGIAVTFSTGWWLQHRPKSAVPTLLPPAIRFVTIAGEVRLGSKSIRAGDAWRIGERLRTDQGRACVTIDASVIACLDADSEASLSALDPAILSLRLERGRLISRLERQPQQRRYVVQTSKASITAKGTEFVVGVDAEQRVSVHLYAGHLSIQSPAEQTSEIAAPSAAVINDTIAAEAWSERIVAADRSLAQLVRLPRTGKPIDLDVMTRPVGASVAIDDFELGPTPISALIHDGHRLIVSMPGYATVTELLPTEPGERLQRNYELSQILLAPRVAVVDTAPEPLAKQKGDQAASTTAATPSSLLARAQALRAEGKRRECVGVYRQLIRSFPSSDEARVSLVSLGELELSELGQPALALRSFESYLRQPGPLTREARFGRIRALQMLSRKTDEQVAVATFLKDYPNSVQAEGLRRRVQTR